MTTTLIQGGTVVNATGTAQADVLIDGETIAAVLAPGSTLLGFDLAGTVDTVIDASGKYVIPGGIDAHTQDRKSTRLNSSHANISYAVFCLKKKKKQQYELVTT